MRKPRVKNKYNLKPKDIERAEVLDGKRLKEKPFWRNDALRAWCLSEWVGNEDDRKFGSGNEYDIAFYDSGEIELFCSCMRVISYNFKTFFNPNEIDHENDLILQEKLLNRLNWLIDERIVRM